ncbi:MAG TPA: right-handed parallel beta-helix repeat-containing protein [Gemmatimonadales bacterium]|nr:right-handed parallel beta-helix repeat-containing protein [Gemmatimonadales bacterium]
MKWKSVAMLGFAALAAGCATDTTAPAIQPAATRPSLAFSASPCTFTIDGTTMRLDADCSTSTTITIPNGFTLDGAGYTITAVNPVSGAFLGGVVKNADATAHVTKVNIRTDGLIGCKGGDERLRGILLEGASGSITHSSVVGINRGASGCQEGNAIEVRNAPFDGTHPNTVSVEIAHNTVADYQKTGIVCNGDANCSIHHNDVGASATQANLAANSVQLGFGATGDLTLNKIAGNSWCINTSAAATAVLLYLPSSGVVVESNRIDGNSDVGIYAYGDGMVIAKNRVADVGADCSVYDVGIGDYGSNYPLSSNSLVKNSVSGFDEPYDPASPGGKNKVKSAQPLPF